MTTRTTTTTTTASTTTTKTTTTTNNNNHNNSNNNAGLFTAEPFGAGFGSAIRCTARPWAAVVETTSRPVSGSST